LKAGFRTWIALLALNLDARVAVDTVTCFLSAVTSPCRPFIQTRSIRCGALTSQIPVFGNFFTSAQARLSGPICYWSIERLMSECVQVVFYPYGGNQLIRMRRALVLAGGGYAASAWEIGLITGMADAGLDVRNADLFVGTSSGSRVALHLASGVAHEDAFQRRLQPGPPSSERPPLVDWVGLRDRAARAKQAGGSPADILRRI